MTPRSLSRQTRGWLLVAAMYLLAGALVLAIYAAATWDHVGPAQHGPVRPAPDPTTGR